jgi:hypothetical protein
VQTVGVHDVDAVVQDVNEAAQRGFDSGRRERAEIADAFAFRADQVRAEAMQSEGDERRRLLNAALADYQACIDNFDGVTGFFNSDRNLERCRRYHESISSELEGEPRFEFSFEPF